MKVLQIYENYKIPQNLQQHMLRVAALSVILGENWQTSSLDKKAVTLACLFHDMANVIKFKFDNRLFKMSADETQYWKTIQQKIIKKYGSNIHLATLQICKEIGLSKKVLSLIENLEWRNTAKMLAENNHEVALSIYCDMRIGPFGIMPLTKRLDDLEKRSRFTGRQQIKAVVPQLEKTIQSQTNIDLQTIKERQIEGFFDQLLALEIVS